MRFAAAVISALSALGGPQVVGSPEVALVHSRSSDDVSFVTSVRLTRALPQGTTGIRASLVVRGATEDIPGIAVLPGTRRCYQQTTFAGAPLNRLRTGAPVAVRLVFRGRPKHEIDVRTRVRERRELFGAAADRRTARHLGCLPAPPHTRCNAVAGASRLNGIEVAEAGRPSDCADALRVMASVGRWVDSSRCVTDLCVHAHRMNAGYRCTVALVGEVSWRITCRRGTGYVVGLTAE